MEEDVDVILENCTKTFALFMPEDTYRRDCGTAIIAS